MNPDFDWYLIINLDDFDAKEVVSTKVILALEGKGNTEFLITKGNAYGVTVEDVFIPVGFEEKNPYEFDERAVYLTPERDLYYGFLSEA